MFGKTAGCWPIKKLARNILPITLPVLRHSKTFENDIPYMFSIFLQANNVKPYKPQKSSDTGSGHVGFSMVRDMHWMTHDTFHKSVLISSHTNVR